MSPDAFRFIHAADVHIDSPLRGLELLDDAPTEILQGATRRAFENLVSIAIAERVAFVILAGDLFDGRLRHHDMHTGIWTNNEIRRLEQAGIPVLLIRGNHDAESKVRTGVSWPANVHEFSVRRPQTFTAEDLGLDTAMRVAVHGQGFARPDAPDDLAAAYPDALPGCFNIGVLHTSLTGDPAHDPYAPTSVDVLVNRGYDYWALGHIHQRSNPPIHESPYIAYSGNLQGRHIRETGAKGCLLVSVEDGHIEDVEFRQTDTVRWHRAEIELERSDGCPELYARLRDALAECHAASDGRFSAIRLEFSGACAAHSELVASDRRSEVVAEIRNLAGEWDGEIWIEKIRFNTSPPLDIEQLREGSDLLGELLRDVSALSDKPESLAELVESSLTELADKASLELKSAGMSLTGPDQMSQWLQQAEGILLSRLEVEA